MADRVAVSKIKAGHGDKRVTIEPGTRFDTATIGLTNDDVAKMDRSGVLRMPKDDIRMAPAVTGPGGAITEEPAAPAESEPKPPAKTSDLDL